MAGKKRQKEETTTPAAETAAADTPATVTAPATATRGVKRYEVAGRIRLGKGDVREPGATIAENELAAAQVGRLLETGFLIDTDAPVAPSEASQTAAFDRLANLARKVGALRTDGAEYRLGEASFTGTAAFRAGVSLDQLEAAIVEKFNE